MSAAPEFIKPRLQPIDLIDFCALDIKPREMVLGPVVPEKGLVMCYAARGTGKTHIALAMGFAVATGTKFLKWSAPKPRNVLLIDGEMPAAALQERLNAIIDANGPPERGRFEVLAGDLSELGIGNLADPKVQAEVDPILEGFEFLILDNLSSLTEVIRDNDPASWGPVQGWLLRLRRRGMSVMIVHHAGKDGEQRGTSRREDVLDTSLSLRRPSDYQPAEGARFEVHIEKGRGIHGDDAKPFEARLLQTPIGMEWTVREIDDVHFARVKALLEDGLSLREIADETGIPKSTIHRMKKKIQCSDPDEKVGQQVGQSWDSSHKRRFSLSQASQAVGTAKDEEKQEHHPTVPLSHPLRDGTVGQHPNGARNGGTASGTPVGQQPIERAVSEPCDLGPGGSDDSLEYLR